MPGETRRMYRPSFPQLMGLILLLVALTNGGKPYRRRTSDMPLYLSKVFKCRCKLLPFIIVLIFRAFVVNIEGLVTFTEFGSLQSRMLGSRMQTCYNTGRFHPTILNSLDPLLKRLLSPSNMIKSANLNFRLLSK